MVAKISVRNITYCSDHAALGGLYRRRGHRDRHLPPSGRGCSGEHWRQSQQRGWQLSRAHDNSRGRGQFTAATRSRVRAGFAVLPSGWPVLGVGARPSGRTGRHTVLPWLMSSLRAIPAYGGGGRSRFWTC